MRPPGITRSRVVKRAPGRRPAHDRRLRAERRARVAARPDHRPLRPRVQDRRATRAVAAELKSRGAEADSVSFRTPRRQPCAAEARLVGVEHQELPERAGGSRPARGRSLIRLAPAVIVVSQSRVGSHSCGAATWEARHGHMRHRRIVPRPCRRGSFVSGSTHSTTSTPASASTVATSPVSSPNSPSAAALDVSPGSTPPATQLPPHAYAR
jgi:hypothetical protein